MNDSPSSIGFPASLSSGNFSAELRRTISLFPNLPWGHDDSGLFDGAEDLLRALRPESAGIASLLALPEGASILLWNWDGIALGRYLQDSGHRVRFHDSRIGYQEAVRLLCGEESIVPLAESAAENEAPDAVFIGNAAADSEELFDTLSKILGNTLDNGGIVVTSPSASLSPPVSPTFLVKSTDDDSLGQESVLVLPNLDSPKLLIRENFLHESPGAWKHLASYLDELGAPRFPGSVPIREVWSLYEEHHRFPLEEVSRAQILWRRDLAERDPVAADFIHQTVGGRYREFWTETLKRRGQPIVERRPIFSGTEQELCPESANADFQHIRIPEPYQTGTTIEDLWLSALQKHSNTEFDNLVFAYFSFLQTRLKPGERCEVDLNPDNLLYTREGKIVPIDQEWDCRPELLSVETAFCRGILYFLARNALRLDEFPSIRSRARSFREFLEVVCNLVSVDCESAVDDLGSFEQLFRSATLASFGVVEVSTLLERCFGDSDLLEVVGILQSTCSGLRRVLIPFPVSTARIGCYLQFQFYETGLWPERFTLLFPSWLGEARVESLEIKGVGDGNVSDILELKSAAEVRAFSKGVIGSNNEAVYAHPQDETPAGIEFALSESGAQTDSNQTLRVSAKVAWPEMIYGRDAEKKLIDGLWQKEEALQELYQRASKYQEEVEHLRDIAHLRSAELELLKSSKAWRVAELLRKVFFGWRRTQDEARNLSAIEQLAQKRVPPTECFSQINESRKISNDAREVSIPGGPLISVIIPVHNTPKAWLADAVNSVRGQTYSSWHLVLVNDGSTDVGTREFLDNLDDPRVTKIQLTRSSGISVATQMGVDGAHGEYIALMDHDDMLAPTALQKVAEEVVRHNSDVVYTDETTFSDRTKEKRDGYFGLPHLKPDYSPDLLLCHNYITHLLVVRKELVDEVGGFRSEFDGAQDYDLLLRLTEKTNRVAHIAEPLYHWRQSAQSTSLDTGAKPLAHMRGCKALSEALDRRGIEGEVLTANGPHFFRARRKIFGQPTVEIVIPFRDQPLMLRKCLDALLCRTRYLHYRILGVNNGSTEVLTHELMSQYESENSHVRFVTLDVPFNFSQIVNFGVKNSDAAHVVLMNNDIEVINNDWMEAMLEHSQRLEVGAVGAKLYYPDDRIQHAGIAIGIGNYAGHPHKHVEGGYSGYLNRLHNIQNVSAVTGAMMMVKRELYNEVEGFDEGSFKIACNDVDFCLRLRSRGLLNIFTPYSRAYHHESVSRGYEDTPEKKARFNKEVDAFRKRHSEALTEGDPYYNRCFRLDTEEVLARPLNET